MQSIAACHIQQNIAFGIKCSRVKSTAVPKVVSRQGSPRTADGAKRLFEYTRASCVFFAARFFRLKGKKDLLLLEISDIIMLS